MRHTFKILGTVISICLAFSFSSNAQSVNWLTAGNTVTATPTLGINTTTGSFPLNIKNASTTQPINFFTNGTQKATILSNGNVGIGLTSPLGRLDIKSSGTSYLTCLNIVDNASVAKTSLFHSGGSFYLGMATAASLADASSDFTQRIRIYEPTTTATNPIIQLGASNFTMLQNGNIGINTTAPTQMVHMNNGAILLQGTVNGLGGPQILFGGTPATAQYGEWGIEYLSVTGTQEYGLNFWKPSGSHKMDGTLGGFNYGLFLNNDGNIGMGVDPWKIDAAYKLSVNGAIRCTKVSVEIGWADYVFNEEYKLMPLNELEKFVSENNHLPNIPPASEIEKNGLDLGNLQVKQMEKIEELTLYIIEMNKTMQAQNERVAQLEKKLGGK